ncbi:hypothetical protein [Loktanella sp. S4079]|uniref:hypothetical protein n=1 Tax=Loktanella sp. S4079 TaxID=579483 RepID=UPI00069661D7|nr:hypothetical protein [Loktanella sp. S4079]
MLRTVAVCLVIGGQVHADDSARLDEFGCAILERPDELTFSTFRDAWRSVAADKLYSLMRHRAVIEDGSCGCHVLRPDWSVIASEFERLGFNQGPRANYDTWVEVEYFPNMETLRNTVAAQCGEIE